MPPLVWHYTSCQTFISILDSKSLWTTHISGLNDTSECRHVFDLFFERFERERDGDGFPASASMPNGPPAKAVRQAELGVGGRAAVRVNSGTITTNN